MSKRRKRLPAKGQKLGRRAVNTRPLRLKFLIVCEGEKTEPNYFKCFRVNVAVVDLRIEGLGYNTLSLVKEACDRMQEDDYDQAWCVFDRDSFSAERFNAALDLARQSGIQVAYSNEAFEIWYLLHFDYHNVAMSRSQYRQMLTKRLGSPYVKNDEGMYSRLEDQQPTAIRNAQRLLDFYGPEHSPERDNPCTTVHRLVQELNCYVR